MPFESTYADWLDPSHGLLQQDAWRALLLTSESAALHAAMDCARRADARSLTALMSALHELGGSPLLASGQPQAMMLKTPDYDNLDPDVINDRSRWRERMPETSVTIDNASYEFAVALCLSRNRNGSRLTMPVKAFQDTLDRGAPPHKEGLTSDEVELLDAAIQTFAKVDTYVGITPERGGRDVTVLRRLFYEVAGCVPTGEAADRFVASGHDIADLSRCKIEDHSKYAKTNRSPLEHAIAWGNPEMAVRIAEALVDDKTYGADHLHKALNTARNDQVHNFGLMVIDEEQRFRTRGAPGDVSEGPRMKDIVRLAELSIQGKAPRVRLALTHQTLEFYLDHCPSRKAVFNQQVAERLVSSIFEDHITDAQRLQVLRDWAQDRNGVTAVRSYLNHSCTPMLELLRPTLPILMAQERIGAPESIIRMASDLSDERVLHPQQFKATLSLVQDLGIDLNTLVANTSSASSNTILHRIASSKSPQTVELMLAAVEAGCDAGTLDSAGRSAAKLIKDKAVRESWDVAIRSINAKSAALSALQELDLGSP